MTRRWLRVAGASSGWSMAASSIAEAGGSARPRLPLAWRLAARELRGGLAGFRLFFFCLALGVGLIAAVGAVSTAVQLGLAHDARQLLGGDVELRLLYDPATPAELADFAQAGKISAVATMRAMALKADGSDRLLVELKAVDQAYPMFGRVELSPDGPLAPALEKRDGAWGAVADREVLERLGLKPGDRLKVGAAQFQIRATVAREPDRGADAFLLGPRLMVGAASLADTGLVEPGSLIYRLYRIAYAPGLDAKAWLADLKQRFPDAGWRIRELSEAAPGVKRFVDRTTLFLTLVGLSALLVGGVGVGNAVGAYLEGRKETIAILKCLGAPAASIFAIYLSLVLLLALGGIALGLVIGSSAPFIAAGPLAAAFGLDLAAGIYIGPLAIAAAFGLLVALGFSLPALMRARDLPPGQLFRDMLEHRHLRRRLLDWLMLALVVGLLVLLTLVNAQDRNLALWFVAASLATLVVFRLLAIGIGHAARRLTRVSRGALRRALADLAAPRAPTGSIVLSLGIGLTVLVAVAGIQGNLRRELAETLPAAAPSFYFIDIQPDQRAAFDAIAQAEPGMADLQRVPMLRGRITRMNGVPVEKIAPPRQEGWVLQGDRGVTWAATVPQGARVVAGAWWPADYQGPPLVSLDAEVADAFGLKLGDSISVNVMGREITGRIANLRRIDWQTLAINFIMVFSPGILEHAPQTDIATLRVPLARELDLQRRLTDRFPNISAIHVREALTNAMHILDAMGAAVAALAAIALVAGVAVLAGAVIADRRRRIYDAVVLKVLGATRSDVVAGLALEYGILGLATAAIALLLGSLSAYAFVTWGMEQPFALLPSIVIGTALAGAGIAVIVGLAGTWRALGQKAAPLLRNE
jgi:putative ABC transport system permease protein